MTLQYQRRTPQLGPRFYRCFNVRFWLSCSPLHRAAPPHLQGTWRTLWLKSWAMHLVHFLTSQCSALEESIYCTAPHAFSRRMVVGRLAIRNFLTLCRNRTVIYSWQNTNGWISTSFQITSWKSRVCPKAEQTRCGFRSVMSSANVD